MNQQRSRRFRAAMEAKEKEEARKESLAMWEGMSHHRVQLCSNDSHLFLAMGKTISDEERSKKSWDSNAITPGTPFMDLLASSLRYWVARKLNTDPGWKGVRSMYHTSLLRILTIPQMEVIISDASVPGEG